MFIAALAVILPVVVELKVTWQMPASPVVQLPLVGWSSVAPSLTESEKSTTWPSTGTNPSPSPRSCHADMTSVCDSPT